MNTFDSLDPDEQVTIQAVADALAQSSQLIDWHEGDPERRVSRKGGKEGKA